MCRLCIVLGDDCVMFFNCLLLPHCVCRLCTDFGVDCVVVVVSLFIVAPTVCVGNVLSRSVIVLWFFHCLLLPNCVCSLCIVLSGDCVVGVSLFFAAPRVCVCCVLSWTVIVFLVVSLFIAALLCVYVMYCPGR